MHRSSPDLIVWLNTSWSELEDLSDELLTVTARNSKGVSDPVVIRDLVYRDAAKHIGKAFDFFLLFKVNKIVNTFYYIYRYITKKCEAKKWIGIY